nr:unnamed protein product [Digitaria exilis]
MSAADAVDVDAAASAAAVEAGCRYTGGGDHRGTQAHPPEFMPPPLNFRSAHPLGPGVQTTDGAHLSASVLKFD